MNRRHFVGTAILVPLELSIASRLLGASRILPRRMPVVGLSPNAVRQTGLVMTEPIDPSPDEACATTAPIDGYSPNPSSNQGYHWAPAEVLNDKRRSFDLNRGRLNDLWRAMAGSQDPHHMLASAVLVALGLPISWNNNQPTLVDPSLAPKLAQLAVTGRVTYGAFRQWHPQDADLFHLVQGLAPNEPANRVQAVASQMLDVAYATIWAIRSNDAGWKAARARMGWIAASGEDDLPDRPVNVPSASHPQYDALVHVVGKLGPLSVWTRYMIASDGNNLQPTGSTPVRAPAPGALRSVPNELPFIPPQDKILIYIHGGGSRLEEAEPLAAQLIAVGKAAGQSYTVIALDMPNTGYCMPFDHTQVAEAKDSYHPSGDPKLVPQSTGTSHLEGYPLMGFEERFVMGFVEALEQQYGQIKNRIAAVMGGSLGGNMSLQLARRSTIPGNEYLKTIVAWSSTCFAGRNDLETWIAGHQVLGVGGDLIGKFTEGENDNSRGEFFVALYDQPLGSIGPINVIGPQPAMWWRDGWPCKSNGITGSRFDRYEYYTKQFRRWTHRLNYEMSIFSFQEGDVFLPNHAETEPRYLTMTSRLLLGAGQQDDYFAVKNYSNTVSVAGKMVNTPGTTLFLKNTGHSIHDERPAFFATQIVEFLNPPPPPRLMSIEVHVVAATATTKTIVVLATDPVTKQPLNDAIVRVYAVAGKPGSQLTYPKAPPQDCVEVVGGEVTTDPRGKPQQSGKPRNVNTCMGTVSKPGYETATFIP